MAKIKNGIAPIEQAPVLIKEIELPSGKKAQIYEGRGKHAIEANAMINGNQSLYQPALMSQLVTIENEALTLEDYGNIPLKDYHTLVGEIAEQNF